MILFFIVIGLCQSKLLDGYAFPVYTTEFCPRNQKEWSERSLALNCTDGNAFMCFPNGNLTQLLEFCYKESKIRIQEGICLFLYKRYSLLDAYDCRGFTYGCPTASHFSDEIYKYPSCVSLGEGCFLSEPSCSRHTLPVQSFEDNDLVRIVIPLGITTLVIAIIIFVLYHKRKSVSQFLRRIFRIKSRETNDDLYHGPFLYNHTEFSLIPEEAAIQMDIEDLEKHGVLIYVSDTDRIEVGRRMKLIEESGKFGESRYVSPLDQWEQEEDVSLYIIRQPIGDLSSFIEFLRDRGADLWKRVQQSPEIYFVLYFPKNKWQNHQTILLKYDFFNKAKVKTI